MNEQVQNNTREFPYQDQLSELVEAYANAITGKDHPRLTEGLALQVVLAGRLVCGIGGRSLWSSALYFADWLISITAQEDTVPGLAELQAIRDHLTQDFDKMGIEAYKYNMSTDLLQHATGLMTRATLAMRNPEAHIPDIEGLGGMADVYTKGLAWQQSKNTQT